MKALFTTMICIAMSVLTSLTSYAQPSKSYWGPDTNQTPPSIETYEGFINHAFSPVNSHLSTNILTDRVGNYMDGSRPSGSIDDAPVNKTTFFQLYAEMKYSMINDSLEKDYFYFDSLAAVERDEYGIVNLGLLSFDYNQISERAKNDGDVYWDDYQLKVAHRDVDYDIFEKRHVHALVPLSDIVTDQGYVTFILQEQFIFTDDRNQPGHVQIDFGDGYGYRDVEVGEPIEIYYNEMDDIFLKSRVFTDFELEFHGVSVFERKEADPVIEYECGQGTTIYNNTAFRDLPQDVVELEADAMIYNNKNADRTKVTGELGIYYGCGNTECEIKKPFIFVSGYGPEVPGFSSQKRLGGDFAKGMLYHHANGILGEEAANGEHAGYNSGTNLLYKLRNEGYDIIILYFDNGVDYVQNHAQLVIRALRYINHQKKLNGSKYENVLMGQSMGGISTRYALGQWERDYMSDHTPRDQYMHHHCRLWISWDGEQQGATIPLGIQLYTWYLIEKLPRAIFYTIFGPNAGGLGAIASLAGKHIVLNNALNNVAAQSMLTYHYSVNNGNNQSQTIRHPNYTRLMNELDLLGYPSCRRVAIADGSSTMQRPEDLVGDIDSSGYGGECLINFRAINPFMYGIPAVQMKATTEKINTDQMVFKGTFRMFGIPVPGSSFWIKKNYKRAESIAPGSYERFHAKYMLPLADNYPFSCSKPKYRATFVPTTSVFDIQDDTTADYGYSFSQNDLFWTDESNTTNHRGYPHIKNVQHKTPFHSIFAMKDNTFHLQNPSSEIAVFFLDEIKLSQRHDQHKQYLGRNNALYSSRLDDGEYIAIGASNTQSIDTGSLIVGEYTDIEYNSPSIIITGQAWFKRASKVRIGSLGPIPNECFTFSDAQGKRTDGGLVTEKIPELNANMESHITVYPQPNESTLNIRIPKELIGGEIRFYTITGQLVQTDQIHSSEQLLDTPFPPGTYILRIKSEGVSYSRKILKL